MVNELAEVRIPGGQAERAIQLSNVLVIVWCAQRLVEFSVLQRLNHGFGECHKRLWPVRIDGEVTEHSPEASRLRRRPRRGGQAARRQLAVWGWLGWRGELAHGVLPQARSRSRRPTTLVCPSEY